MRAAAGGWLHTHAAGGPRLPAVIFIRRRRNPSSGESLVAPFFLLGLHVCGLLVVVRRRRRHGVGGTQDVGRAQGRQPQAGLRLRLRLLLLREEREEEKKVLA